MNKKPWQHCVRDARLVFIYRDHFAYVYGSNGECPQTYEEAKALVDRLWAQYPDHFQKSVIDRGHTKEELIQHIIGKKCFDCSSFVCAVTQFQGSIFDMVVVQDYNSYGLHDIMEAKSDPKDGFWGSVLWIPGHVAIDCGNGLAIDFANEFVDVREYRFVGDDALVTFNLAGRLPWVDYCGSIDL